MMKVTISVTFYSADTKVLDCLFLPADSIHIPLKI